MGKRLLSSLLNIIFCWLNVVLFIFNIKPIGCMLFKTDCPTDRKGKFIYGISSLIQWILMALIIGLIFTIIFWIKDQPSIAQRIAKQV